MEIKEFVRKIPENKVVKIEPSDLLRMLDESYEAKEKASNYKLPKIDELSFKDKYEYIDKYIIEPDNLLDGVRVYYPHGIVLRQPSTKNYYRGENRLYRNCVPSLVRKIDRYSSREDKEIYRLIQDMRIYEFSYIIKDFKHVKRWKCCDVLYDVIAQHYGIDTCWLDITSNLGVALFFATCFYKDGKWYPLTNKETQINEDCKFGVIFHTPSNEMSLRWCAMDSAFNPKTLKEGYFEVKENEKYLRNLVYPIGYQPFMRCSMQEGYAIYMRENRKLEDDPYFTKYIFKHDEDFSKEIFKRMKEGKLIYPFEGLNRCEEIIDKIKTTTNFSYSAFKDALYKNQYFSLKDEKYVLDKLKTFKIDDKDITISNNHPIYISKDLVKEVDNTYKDFSLEKIYGTSIYERIKTQEFNEVLRPYMVIEEDGLRGVNDYKLKKHVNCNYDFYTIDAITLKRTVEKKELPKY